MGVGAEELGKSAGRDCSSILGALHYPWTQQYNIVQTQTEGWWCWATNEVSAEEPTDPAFKQLQPLVLRVTKRCAQFSVAMYS